MHPFALQTESWQKTREIDAPNHFFFVGLTEFMWRGGGWVTLKGSRVILRGCWSHTEGAGVGSRGWGHIEAGAQVGCVPLAGRVALANSRQGLLTSG